MKTILLFILLLFPFSVEAKTEVNEHLIDAEIEIAGALRVKEIIVVSGNQESFSRTLNYKNVKEDWDGKTIDLNDLSMYNGYSLENIKVSAFPYEKGIDLNYETEDFLEELNVKKKKKNYYIKTDNDLGTNIEIFYENKKSNKTVYYIEYLVSNVMVMHNDITELNYTFKNLNYMSKETKLRIINPYPTDSKLFHVWMHGPKSGDLQYLINDNEEKVGIISSFKDLDVDLNVRITLPKEHVGIDIYLNKTNKDALEDIITIEDNIMNYKTKPFVILKYILIVLSVLYVLGSFILFKCSTKSINILYLFLGFLIILFNKIFKYNIIYLYFIPLIPVIILCIKNKLIKRKNQNEKKKNQKKKK